MTFRAGEKPITKSEKRGLCLSGRNSSPHLLWRDVKRDCPEVDLPVGVDARDDEEDAGALGAALAQATEAENDGTLVLLNNLEKKLKYCTTTL